MDDDMNIEEIEGGGSGMDEGIDDIFCDNDNVDIDMDQIMSGAGDDTDDQNDRPNPNIGGSKKAPY